MVRHLILLASRLSGSATPREILLRLASSPLSPCPLQHLVSLCKLALGYSKRWSSSDRKAEGLAAQKARSPEVSFTNALKSTEDSIFYERYLKKNVGYMARREWTGLWLRGLRDKPGDTLSRASATGDPLQTFRDPSASLDTATASLEAMIASIHSSTSVKARLQDELRERSLGKQALRWYLKSDAYNRFDLSPYSRVLQVTHAQHCRRAARGLSLEFSSKQRMLA